MSKSRKAGDVIKNSQQGAEAALASQAAKAMDSPSSSPSMTTGKGKDKNWSDPYGEGGYDGPITDYNFYKTGGKYFDSHDRKKLEKKGYKDSDINDYVKAIQSKYVRGEEKLIAKAHLPTVSELDGFDPYQFDNNNYHVLGKGKPKIDKSAMDFMLNYGGEYGDHAFNAQQLTDWNDENNYNWGDKSKKELKNAVRDYVPEQPAAPDPEPEPPTQPPVVQPPVQPPREVKPPTPVAPPPPMTSKTPTEGDPTTPLTQKEWNEKYVVQPEVKNQDNVVVNSPSSNFATARASYRAANDAMYGFEGMNYANAWLQANPTKNWSPTTRKYQAQENVYQMKAEAEVARNRVFGDLDNFKPALFTAFPVDTKKPKMPNLTPPASVTTPMTFGGM